jgi:hypothetical protein
MRNKNVDRPSYAVSAAQYTQIPPTIVQAVSLYKTFAAEYSAATDPTLKAAYKTVLDAKYAQITNNLSTYTASIQSYLTSIKVDTST